MAFTSNSKTWVDEDGFSNRRRQRGATISQANDHYGNFDLEEGAVDVFVYLESTSIDADSAKHLRKNINDVLGVYHCRLITIYTLNTLSFTIKKNLYLGDVVLKSFYARKAVCRECKALQECQQKLDLLESQMVVDVGRFSMSLKNAKLVDHPIIIITNDDDTIGHLANLLERQFGVVFLRILPLGMQYIPMYRDLSEDELARKEAKRLLRQSWLRGQAQQRGQSWQQGQRGQSWQQGQRGQSWERGQRGQHRQSGQRGQDRGTRGI